MAGLGFKDFQVGEVLTSTDVDGYLMQQTVMRFADAVARGSALGTAAGTGVPLAEGMVSYRDDLNAIQVYDGTAWRDPAIGIGTNVVSVNKADTFSTTSTSFTPVTGLSASITPSTSSSKILVLVHGLLGMSTSEYTFLEVDRGGTAIGSGTGGSVNGFAFIDGEGFVPDNTAFGNASFVYLDSPATTSSTTYTVQMRVTGGTGYLGRTGEGTAAGASASLTLIEVAA